MFAMANAVKMVKGDVATLESNRAMSNLAGFFGKSTIRIMGGKTK